MHACGSIEYTRETLRNLYLDIVSEISNLGGHPKLLLLLEKLDSQLDTDLLGNPPETAAMQSPSFFYVAESKNIDSEKISTL